MAAGYLPPPGAQYGPCVEPCKHRDCAASRATAESICRHCGKLIGYDVRYFDERDERGNLVGHLHEICELVAIEREQLAEGLPVTEPRERTT